MIFLIMLLTTLLRLTLEIRQFEVEVKIEVIVMIALVMIIELNLVLIVARDFFGNAILGRCLVGLPAQPSGPFHSEPSADIDEWWRPATS